MHLIYPNDIFTLREVDPEYATEAEVARQDGLRYDVIDLMALEQGDAVHAVRFIPPRDRLVRAIYRGWMLRSDHYAQLFDALLDRGIRLVTDPVAYRLTHELPQWYDLLPDVTPQSVVVPWTGSLDVDSIMQAVAPFGQAPVIVKDFVKSRKHDWAAACFIPNAGDRATVERVTRRFVELQGNDLQGGLVFRAFVDLQPVGHHQQSGMPLTKEYRLFCWNNSIISVTPYWEGTTYDEVLPVEQFRPLAARVPSPFFVIDVAQRADGAWVVIELGDGQVAGLPERLQPRTFYAALRSVWNDIECVNE